LTIQPSKIRKLLVINLGQVGDVIMSFPALIAIRKHFSSSEIIAVAGKTPAELIGDLGFADRVIAVDRHALLDGPKIASISKIFDILREVRRERFDLVIDLHSLYESNLLGFLSGARHRLFANRRNRSLDRLSNVRPRPAPYDPAKHLSAIYLDVIRPLGISGDSDVRISPPLDLVERFRSQYSNSHLEGQTQIGLAIGAGHPSRKWSLKNYVDLAMRLQTAKNSRVFVFLGPEEKAFASEILERFAGFATIVPDLKLIELAAAFSTLDIFVGNDTGTTHLAAVCGPQTIMICDARAPVTFNPLGTRSKTVRSDMLEKTTVEDVLQAIE
jgi:ADP-heptose:LPS heptosyltransferase